MNTVTQGADERSPDSSSRARCADFAAEIATAYADATTGAEEDSTRLPATLLTALGAGTFETMAGSAGLAIFAEALSTLHILTVCHEAACMGEADVPRWQDALGAVRLRLEAAFSLVHVELRAARVGDGEDAGTCAAAVPS